MIVGYCCKLGIDPVISAASLHLCFWTRRTNFWSTRLCTLHHFSQIIIACPASRSCCQSAHLRLSKPCSLRSCPTWINSSSNLLGSFVYFWGVWISTQDTVATDASGKRITIKSILILSLITSRQGFTVQHKQIHVWYLGYNVVQRFHLPEHLLIVVLNIEYKRYFPIELLCRVQIHLMALFKVVHLINLKLVHLLDVSLNGWASVVQLVFCFFLEPT